MEREGNVGKERIVLSHLLEIPPGPRTSVTNPIIIIITTITLILFLSITLLGYV